MDTTKLSAKAKNGESPSAPELPAEQKRKNAALSKQRAAAFGEIVALLMRSPQHKPLRLTDLEWLIAPAITAGQFSVAEAQSKQNGHVAPIGFVVWASVSAEVDQRLTAALDKAIKLTPQEWTSGDIVWVVEAVGPPNVIEATLKQVADRIWKGKTVKLRIRNKDGKTVVAKLGAQPKA